MDSSLSFSLYSRIEKRKPDDAFFAKSLKQFNKPNIAKNIKIHPGYFLKSISCTQIIQQNLRIAQKLQPISLLKPSLRHNYLKSKVKPKPPRKGKITGLNMSIDKICGWVPKVTFNSN